MTGACSGAREGCEKIALGGLDGGTRSWKLDPNLPRYFLKVSQNFAFIQYFSPDPPLDPTHSKTSRPSPDSSARALTISYKQLVPPRAKRNLLWTGRKSFDVREQIDA
jgi:hypothetical protein